MTDSRTQRRPRTRAASGFTLVEILVAIAILATVMAMVLASFEQTFQAKKIIEKNAVRYHSVRIAVERLAREISMAYISQSEDTTQAERRTFFISKKKGDVDEIRFSMFGHQRLYADAHEADTSQVAYYGMRDKDSSDKMNLVRRETRRLSYDKLEKASGSSDILCDDVVSLKFMFWDAIQKDWKEEWSTLAADGQANRMPSRVKITLTVKDERGTEVPFTTSVRIPMQEPLFTQPRTM